MMTISKLGFLHRTSCMLGEQKEAVARAEAEAAKEAETESKAKTGVLVDIDRDPENVACTMQSILDRMDAEQAR